MNSVEPAAPESDLDTLLQEAESRNETLRQELDSEEDMFSENSRDDEGYKTSASNARISDPHPLSLKGGLDVRESALTPGKSLSLKNRKEKTAIFKFFRSRNILLTKTPFLLTLANYFSLRNGYIPERRESSARAAHIFHANFYLDPGANTGTPFESFFEVRT